MDLVGSLQAMLEQGQDSALLRFSLGGEYLKRGDLQPAIAHLRSALSQDQNYSAAYKLLGKALVEDNQSDAAKQAYTQGISIAEACGDKQAAKEMTIFLRRLNKAD
jgi:Tfp pilus assembly protein PilF